MILSRRNPSQPVMERSPAVMERSPAVMERSPAVMERSPAVMVRPTAVMARRDRAISSNMMNKVMARSGRATTFGRPCDCRDAVVL
jgi:hypothetical protein